MRLKIAAIHGVARLAAAMPPLRRVLIGILDRVPRLKQRLKRANATALASQRAATRSGDPDEDALLSPNARRVLRDLRRESARIEHRRGPPS